MPQAPVTADLLDNDLHVIGIDEKGDVILFDSSGRDTEPYTTSENLIEWGIHNLREEEVKRLLALDGLRPIDRAFLAAWHPGITLEEGWAVGERLGY